MTAAAFTESEKERIRYHMGYLASSSAASIQFGLPRPLQTLFILEDAISLITNPHAQDRVRNILSCLDQIEGKLKSAQCTLMAEKLGQLVLHPGRDKGLFATDLLEREYVRWVNRLADILGAPKYVYSERFRRRGPGSVLAVSG